MSDPLDQQVDRNSLLSFVGLNLDCDQYYPVRHLYTSLLLYSIFGDPCFTTLAGCLQDENIGSLTCLEISGS